ncbi:MAG: short chain dehydrogenase [Elusimicrobia bacterium]|nr:MAG: short chain dehydrogenase [Elusimicrobiota bacterium]
MKDLKDKTVLVTGASSGIGRATALAFAKRGCRVALAARRTDKLAALAENLKGKGVQTLVIACDVKDRAQAKNAVEAVIKEWGQLHILINNAGISDLHYFNEADLDRIEDIFQTNLLGTVYTCHAALTHMREKEEGHIVNVASVAGLTGVPWMAAYSSSKFAMVGLTEALRRELYNSGVTLTAYCPGTVDTPMAEEPLRDANLRRTISPKTPEQAADKIVYAVQTQAPEIVYGEVSAFLLRFIRFFPRLADWATYRAVTRSHPQVRALLSKKS